MTTAVNSLSLRANRFGPTQPVAAPDVRFASSGVRLDVRCHNELTPDKVLGTPPTLTYGLLASTILYPLPNTNTFDVRQMIRSRSTMVRMRNRNFHSSRC